MNENNITHISNHQKALSEKAGIIIKNEKSQFDDKLAFKCNKSLFVELKSNLTLEFKDTIFFDKTIGPSLIRESLLNQGCTEEEVSYLNVQGDKENKISPDGGFIYFKINGNIYPIISTEQKRQGTNDLRMKEGKKKQATGNAIERAGKNFNFYRDSVCALIDIVPYVIFAQGCDFSDDSEFVKNKVRYTISGNLNTLNIYKNRLGHAGSCFAREETWAENEIKEIIKNVANESIRYYEKLFNKKILI